MLRPMLLAACCAALVSTAAPSPHTGWSALDDGGPAAMEIDRRRVRRDGAHAEVWVRIRGDRDAVATEFEAAGAAPEDVDRVRRTLGRSEHRWAFRCDEGSHALAVSAYYADDGTLIRAFAVDRPAWWPVEPDTVGDRLLRAVCGRAARPSVADGVGPGEADVEDGAAVADPR